MRKTIINFHNFRSITYLKLNHTIVAPNTCRKYVNVKKNHSPKKNIIPIYIDLEPRLRLIRAMRREAYQENPDYKELCRRFLADEEDFSDEKLKKAGIEKRYYNKDLSKCINNIIKDLNL